MAPATLVLPEVTVDDKRRIIEYLGSSSRLIEGRTPKPILKAAGVVIDPFREVFNSGSEELDEERVREVLERAGHQLSGISTREELEKKLREEGTPVGKERNMELLPGILALAPFDVGLEDYVDIVTQGVGTELRTRHALQYFDIWKEVVGATAKRRVLRRLLNQENNQNEHDSVAYVVAQHFKKIKGELREGDPLVKYILNEIVRAGEVLPIISDTAFGELDPRIKVTVEQIVKGEKAWESTGVTTKDNRTISYSRCEELEKRHMQTFCKLGEDYVGKTTLVYVDGRLVGSIKTDGAKTMLATTSVKTDESVYVLVQGGVYQVTQKVKKAAVKAATKRRGVPGILHVDSLEVSPIRFMYSGEGMGRVVENARLIERRRAAIEQNVNNYHRK